MNVFLKKLAKVLFKQIKANKNATKLQKSKNLFHELIYSPKSIEFKTFKNYIKINLLNNFIKPSKSSINALILFF